jgi:hypothetical protein
MPNRTPYCPQEPLWHEGGTPLRICGLFLVYVLTMVFEIVCSLGKTQGENSKRKGDQSR